MHTMDELKEKQSLPLNLKIRMTQERIRAWVNFYGVDGVYISFSGGKDSTVLLDIVRSMYFRRIPAVFVDVPTQYPELKEFATSFDNVTVVKPKISFAAVCEKYGFPLISKEVSECVQGARKYLTSLLNDGTLAQTDRQTDRPYRYWYDRVTGTGKYQKKPHIPNADEKSLSSMSRGGYDRKYRRVRGIEEFTRKANKESPSGFITENSNDNGDADKGLRDKGKYP
jgi:hypothetical protein